MKEGGMGKRFGLSFSRVLPSLQACRPKDPANAVSPAFCLSPVNPKTRDIDFPAPPPRHYPAATLGRLAPVVASNGCCGPRRLRSNPGADEDLSRARETPAYLWRREEKWHVVAAAPGGDNISPRRKIDSDGSGGGGIFFPPGRARRRRAGKKKKTVRSRGRRSTSSADSGWFSSEDEENDEREDDRFDDDGDETETLLSSFETDSTSEATKAREVKQRTAVVAESFAVVKRSEDPHGDFRRSMAEMVLEKQIYDSAGLEQLLHCFLSLNSRHHHAAIVAAFADIWDAIFPATTAVSLPHSCHK